METALFISVAALVACLALCAHFAARLRVVMTGSASLRDRLDRAEAAAASCSEVAEAWRSRAEDEREARAIAETAAARIAGLEAERAELQRDVTSLSGRAAALATQLAEQELSHQQKVAALTTLRGDMAKDFQNMASESLRANQASFLHLANAVLDKHKEGAAADLGARQQQIETLVAPIRDTLQQYQAKLGEIETARAEAYGAISAELKTVAAAQHAVRSETSKLVNALRAAPKTRGRWGEHTLRNVLDLAGLSPYCDFVVEQSFTREGVVLRPDAIIRLPGGRSIVVDAKAPVSAYLDAVEAVDDDERERCLRLYAVHLRAQVRLLAGKAYWDGLTGTPDYVVMFVPGENFYAAAAERDPDLFEDAAKHRVLIATPASLIALAKMAAYGWRQEKVADNAKRVHELGRDLYKRLATMGEHVLGLGQNLTKTVRKYNEFVGSLEASVMPQARRFHELEVEGATAEITALQPVETEPRSLRADRDIPISLVPPEAA